MKLKKNKKILLCSIIMLIVSTVIVFAFLSANTASEIERLNKKSVSELFNAVNRLDKSSIESGEASLYAQALLDKMDDFGKEKMEKNIKDDKNSCLLRVMLLQLANEKKTELNYQELSNLVFDPDTDYDIKYNIVINIGSLGKSPELLEQIYHNAEEDIAFQAMRMLFLCDHERWYKLADEIIDNREKVSEKKLKSALLEMGAWINSFGSAEDIPVFISVCDELLRDVKISENIKECAFVALDQIKNKSSIMYIIRSDKISESQKVMAVYENVGVLLDMVSVSMTTEELNTVLAAMQIYPLKEFEAPLRQTLSELSGIMHMSADSEEYEKLKTEIQSTLEQIEKYGERAYVD